MHPDSGSCTQSLLRIVKAVYGDLRGTAQVIGRNFAGITPPDAPPTMFPIAPCGGGFVFPRVVPAGEPAAEAKQPDATAKSKVASPKIRTFGAS